MDLPVSVLIYTEIDVYKRQVIVRENEYVVLQYRLTPQYHSAFLREHFIGPQNAVSYTHLIAHFLNCKLRLIGSYFALMLICVACSNGHFYLRD